MTIDSITRKQADALAALIHAFRPDWDKAGCWAAISAAKDVATGRDLAVAAVRASGLATNRTPTVIGMEGPHWRNSDHAPRLPEIPPEERCSICSRRKGSCGTDHRFISAAVAKREPASEATNYAQMIRDDLIARKAGVELTPRPDPLPGLICDLCLEPADHLESVFRENSTRRYCPTCAAIGKG